MLYALNSKSDCSEADIMFKSPLGSQRVIDPKEVKISELEGKLQQQTRKAEGLQA